jgi:alanine dehydrogenase
MTEEIRLGLASMHHETGEKRDFLPDFVALLALRGIKIVLEKDYGTRMGFRSRDYLRLAPSVHFGSHEEVYNQDYVMVLRYPSEDLVCEMKPGACLISMLHMPTRPSRVEYLRSLGLEGISLESIQDDTGRRLIENLKAVAWNGMEAAFHTLKGTYPEPGFESTERPPIYVTLLGAGSVGSHVVRAAVRYGDPKYQQMLAQRGVPGVQVNVVDYDLSGHEKIMLDLLKRTDILVDATQRPDPSKPVIPNDWIAAMPDHAVLLDLSVDPYDCNASPPFVKGIEGIPQGNLDQYVFTPNDPVYDKKPECVKSTCRRHAVSCYSWPGVHPIQCMEVYGKQLAPIFRTLVEIGGIENIDPQGRFFERAIARSQLSRWKILQEA